MRRDKIILFFLIIFLIILGGCSRIIMDIQIKDSDVPIVEKAMRNLRPIFDSLGTRIGLSKGAPARFEYDSLKDVLRIYPDIYYTLNVLTTNDTYF